MSTRRTLAAGAIVACAYLSVAVVTARVSGHSVLPLYEGVGNLPPYDWVNPPPAFASSNVAPKANTTAVALDADGNKLGGVTSADTQFIVTLDKRAIPPRAGATQASVAMEPLDPATLGALPSGVRSDGNAYRLSVHYEPGDIPLTKFARQTSAELSVPLPANRGLFFSTDGQSWTRLGAPPPKAQTATISSSFLDTGIFLAGTTHRAIATSGSGGTPIVTVIIGVLVGVALVGGAVWFLLRLRNPVTLPARTRPAKGGRPQARPAASRRPPPKRR